MNCLYPHNTGQTAYWKGCRCDRCRAAKASTWVPKPKPRPCRRCGTLEKPIGGWYCEECGPIIIVDRVSAKIEIDAGGCWIFTGNKTSGGYGLVSRHRGQVPRTTHRVIYEALVGPVPDGLQLDHLCRKRACCNPDHLEPVTRSENVRRAALYREAIA